jgi:hypothetical protein
LNCQDINVPLGKSDSKGVSESVEDYFLVIPSTTVEGEHKSGNVVITIAH